MKRGDRTQRGKWPLGARIAIDVRGAHPVAKGSMRAFVVKGRAVVSDSKSAELRAFERDVRLLATTEMDRWQYPCAVEQPFEVLLCYYMPRPSGDFTKSGELKGSARCEPWTKPDLDKLERATLDALTGIVWDDDSRVCRVVKEKRYATASRDVGVWIEVRVRAATVRELAAQQQLTTQQGATP